MGSLYRVKSALRFSRSLCTGILIIHKGNTAVLCSLLYTSVTLGPK